MWELETLGRFYSRNWNYLDLRVLGQVEIRERERERAASHNDVQVFQGEGRMGRLAL